MRCGGHNLRLGGREDRLLGRLLSQLLTVARAIHVSSAAESTSSATCIGFGPFDFDDQVVISVALQSLHSCLGIILAHEGNVGETARNFLAQTVLNLGQRDTVDAAETTEEIMQIVLGRGLG